VPALACPSDPDCVKRTYQFWGRPYGKTDYGFCTGDCPGGIESGSAAAPQQPRGIFGPHFTTDIALVRDGTANTVALGEIITGTAANQIKGGVWSQGTWDNTIAPTSCLAHVGTAGQYTPPTAGDIWRGNCWCQGYAAHVAFNTAIAPNGPSCSNWRGQPGFYTAQSYHAGGVNVCMADGAVRFISETIDTGNSAISWNTYNGTGANATPMGPSPYGVWGALGSRAGGEPLGNF